MCNNRLGKRLHILPVIMICIMVLFFAEAPIVAEQKTQNQAEPLISAKSAVLIEGTTGKLLFEKEKDQERMIASVTKVMTLLLIYEKLDEGSISMEDQVIVSEHAASMGGSQVWLEQGEVQTVENLIKCIVISSANDAAVAMAEFISGSEEAFVSMMNQRAKQLGMEHTHYLNCCGLDDGITTGQYSSAYDVALVSRELMMKHPQIQKYTMTRSDTLIHHTRRGDKELGLQNTNKLLRYYDGITGLKTGSTSKAGYCFSASATRDGVVLFAVVLGEEHPKERFEDTRKLLDYGFATTFVYSDKEPNTGTLKVSGGKEKEVKYHPLHPFSIVLDRKTMKDDIEKKVIVPEKISAPVGKNEPVGSVQYFDEGKMIGQVDLIAEQGVLKSGYKDRFMQIVRIYFLGLRI